METERMKTAALKDKSLFSRTIRTCLLKAAICPESEGDECSASVPVLLCSLQEPPVSDSNGLCQTGRAQVGREMNREASPRAPAEPCVSITGEHGWGQRAWANRGSDLQGSVATASLTRAFSRKPCRKEKLLNEGSCEGQVGASLPCGPH